METDTKIEIHKKSDIESLSTPCYRTFGEMTYELKGLIKKNIIIKKDEYNEYFYDLTHLGEKLLKQYKSININEQ